MKKSRFLAMVLVLSLTLMGAGYAFWTDALAINNTVDTGKFDVSYVVDRDHPRAETKEGRNSDPYMAAKISKIDEKTLTFEVTDIYPGGYARYDIKVKNNGTLPVVLSGATLKVEENEELAKLLTAQFSTGKICKSNQLDKYINDNLIGTKIEPGQTKTFYGVFRMPTTVSNENNVEETSVRLNLTLNWTQHNDKSVVSVVQ